MSEETIVFENPRRIICSCGWWHDAPKDITEFDARKIASNHIMIAHSGPTTVAEEEFDALPELEKLEEFRTINLGEMTDVEIRVEALTQAVNSLQGVLPTREMLEERTFRFEAYIRTGSFDTSQ